MTDSEQDRVGLDEIADRVMAAVGRRLASFEERMVRVEEGLREEVGHVRAAVQVVDLLADDVRSALTEPPAAEDIVLRRLDTLEERLAALHRAIDALGERLAPAADPGRTGVVMRELEADAARDAGVIDITAERA